MQYLGQIAYLKLTVVLLKNSEDVKDRVRISSLRSEARRQHVWR